jgi:putative salt-induced outer membrane protein YdiY
MRVACCLLSILLVIPAIADVLILDNGDRITGELQSLSEGKLTWASERFGVIVVKQSTVALVETREQFQISVGRDPAYSNCLLSIQGEQQTMLCDEQVVNIADWRLVTAIATMQMIERDIGEYTGRVIVGLEDSSGNSIEQGYEVDSEMQVRYDLIRHRVSVEYDVREREKIRTKNQTKFAYNVDWFFTDDWFFNGNGSYERNEFKALQERKAGGLGLGLQALDSNIMALSMEAGITHFYEQFEKEDNQEFDSLRWNLDYKWVIGGSGTEFFHKHTLFQSFAEGEDWEWESDTGVSLPIKGRLKSIFKLEYDYRNLPAEQDDPIDRVWSLGLGYDW